MFRVKHQEVYSVKHEKMSTFQTLQREKILRFHFKHQKVYSMRSLESIT